MENFLNAFRLFSEKEKHLTVIETIQSGVAFRGTNLWILIFAIFVASIGLNVNSMAVIIGAMLISPIMGPIMGLGLGMGINDLALVKRSLSNYLFAAGVGLTTSTLYFLVTPLNEAHSEILARVEPNIYDVLIAFFSGLAGIIATSSKLKGNVIPGVAIATALMPPLCTAGYGLATFQFPFFFGALYLFIINTVFIALATLLAVRFLKFPYKHLPDEKADERSKQIIWVVVVVTLLPSIYFGYDTVQQNRFVQNVNNFIANEAVFPNDYLLNKTINPRKKSIVLIYGGQKIEPESIEILRNKLPYYNLEGADFQVKQGFAYLEEQNRKQSGTGSELVSSQSKQLELLQNRLDSMENQMVVRQQVFAEMKALYPAIQEAVIEPATHVFGVADSLQHTSFAFVKMTRGISRAEKNRMEAWLKTRLNLKTLVLVAQ